MYWETPPVTAQSSSEPFEFVMIDSLQLRHAGADAATFSSHFRPCAESAVVTFPNLGHDATLVVPCPAEDTPLDSYTHIAAFMRGARPEQVRTRVSFRLVTTFAFMTTPNPSLARPDDQPPSPFASCLRCWRSGPPWARRWRGRWASSRCGCPRPAWACTGCTYA